MARRTFRIAALGLRPPEVNALRSLCVLSAHASRAVSYQIAENDGQADLFLVDASNPDMVLRWRALGERRTVPVVFLDLPRDARATQYMLRRPLLASKLLAVLDEVANNAERGSPATIMPFTVGGASASGAAPPPAKARGHAVLVVDDSPTVRKHVELVLRERDADVILASSGEQALDAIIERAFDLVLLDVVMPGADGYQVCKAIKRGVGGKETPVVMLTSRSSPFDKIRGSLAGCDAYLVKPVAIQNLRRVLDTYLGGSPRAQQAEPSPIDWSATQGRPA